MKIKFLFVFLLAAISSCTLPDKGINADNLRLVQTFDTTFKSRYYLMDGNDTLKIFKADSLDADGNVYAIEMF